MGEVLQNEIFQMTKGPLMADANVIYKARPKQAPGHRDCLTAHTFVCRIKHKHFDPRGRDEGDAKSGCGGARAADRDERPDSRADAEPAGTPQRALRRAPERAVRGIAQRRRGRQRPGRGAHRGGERAFCAGADLKEMRRGTTANRRSARRWGRSNAACSRWRSKPRSR